MKGYRGHKTRVVNTPKIVNTPKLNGYQGHKIYLASTPKGSPEAELLKKLAEGPKRTLVIRWVAAESGKPLYPAYQEEIPVGLKMSVTAPLDYSKRDRWPEYDMVLVTMPDERLELEVRYRKVSILEFGALEKKAVDPNSERPFLYYPSPGAR